jgi:transcriptional regulator with XRE-family HTH domain
MSAEPRLADALRWLRLRAQLTQQEVGGRVHEAGGEISTIYLSMLERGQRNPSPAKLDLLLSALDSDRSELRALYRDEPWAATPLPRGRSAPRIRRRSVAAPAASPTWSSSVLSPPPPADEQLGELATIWRRLSPARREKLLRQARRHAAADDTDQPTSRREPR